MWEVEYTDEFEKWWKKLTEVVQIDVAAYVELIEKCGPDLKFPYSSGVHLSKHPHMRELRVQHKGKPYRILYAFDLRRCAILLIGGNKASDKRWYEKFVPKSDKLYDDHINELIQEKLIND